MALVYSATSGVAGELVPLMTPTGSVASRVLDVSVLGPTGPAGPTGPTGPAFSPTAAVNVTWDATAPLTYTLLAAGHTPGLYLVAYSEVVRVQPAAGNTTANLQWTAPGAIAISQLVTSAAPLATNRVINTVTRVVRSDGSAAIVLANTAAALSGTAAIDFSGQALLIGT